MMPNNTEKMIRKACKKNSRTEVASNKRIGQNFLTGDMKQADHSPFSLIPGFDGLGSGQQFGLAVLTLEVVNRLIREPGHARLSGAEDQLFGPGFINMLGFGQGNNMGSAVNFFR